MVKNLPLTPKLCVEPKPNCAFIDCANSKVANEKIVNFSILIGSVVNGICKLFSKFVGQAFIVTKFHVKATSVAHLPNETKIWCLTKSATTDCTE